MPRFTSRWSTVALRYFCRSDLCDLTSSIPVTLSYLEGQVGAFPPFGATEVVRFN